MDKKRKLLFKATVQRVRHSNIDTSSVNIAYFVALSLFPMLVTLGALLPYFNIDPDSIIRHLDNVIPLPLLETMSATIYMLLTKTNGGLLSLGIIFTLISAKRGMVHVQRGLDRIYGVDRSRGAIASAVISLLTFILIIVLVLGFTVVFGFGKEFFGSVAQQNELTLEIMRGFDVMRWTASFLALLFSFTLIYKVAPNVRHRISDVWPGALISTVCLVVLVQVFALYLKIDSVTLTAYGILSAFFVFMIWLRLLGYVMLLGAAVNAALLEINSGPPEIKNSPIDNFIKKLIDRCFVKRDS